MKPDHLYSAKHPPPVFTRNAAPLAQRDARSLAVMNEPLKPPLVARAKREREGVRTGHETVRQLVGKRKREPGMIPPRAVTGRPMRRRINIVAHR